MGRSRHFRNWDMRTPKLYDTLTYYPIQIPTKIVMHHENPLGTHQVLTPELLRDENFILMGPDHTTQTQLFQAFEQAGVIEILNSLAPLQKPTVIVKRIWAWPWWMILPSKMITTHGLSAGLLHPRFTPKWRSSHPPRGPVTDWIGIFGLATAKIETL